MSELAVDVIGVPVPWARPRLSLRSGRAHGYTVEAVVLWESTIATEALAQAGRARLEGPLEVVLEFRCVRPTRATVRRLRGVPSTRATGDPDNLAKAVLDACNGVLWIDDAQVIDLHVRKRFAAEREHPGVRILVRQVEGVPA